jgi:undecaprenyl diphosphate synthase
VLFCGIGQYRKHRSLNPPAQSKLNSIMPVPKHIDKNNIPRHVAIIMDGNGRWAKSQGQDRIFGHFNGVDAVRDSLNAATELGVEYLTLYAFSTENWNRPLDEVQALMDLLVKTIVQEINELDEKGVRLMAIGDLQNLPGSCQQELEAAMARTAKNTKVKLVLALSYSARWEIVRAVREIVGKGIPAESITDETIREHLCTHDMPDPELMIRTSGEQRISNFLLWQLAYSELYFTNTFWPDFRKADFYEAIADYQSRERRFGKTSDQLTVNQSE